mmetsp:Transcript_6293/g.16050  ORF Transcript_6293/g.16050 Transcript_6293/m.16050 type:complete len:203 (-) Transcript_6293:1471-2079(-)
MENVERILSELLSEYNTVHAAPRTYKLILDDIISTTSAKYVTESTAGYFPNLTQPAFLCVRAMVFLSRAAQVQGDECVALLVKALADVEKAQWDGTDMNTKKFKSSFLQLREDASARSHDEYNHKLGELYNYAGDMFESARGKGVPDVENMFTAMAQLATAVSIPLQPPYALNIEECEGALIKAERMIRYALRVAQRRAAAA